MTTIPAGYAEVFGEVLEERERAVLLCDGIASNPDRCRQQWFPKSVLSLDRREDGQITAVYCRRWFLDRGRLWHWTR